MNRVFQISVMRFVFFLFLLFSFIPLRAEATIRGIVACVARMLVYGDRVEIPADVTGPYTARDFGDVALSHPLSENAEIYNFVQAEIANEVADGFARGATASTLLNWASRRFGVEVYSRQIGPILPGHLVFGKPRTKEATGRLHVLGASHLSDLRGPTTRMNVDDQIEVFPRLFQWRQSTVPRWPPEVVRAEVADWMNSIISQRRGIVFLEDGHAVDTSIMMANLKQTAKDDLWILHPRVETIAVLIGDLNNRLVGLRRHPHSVDENAQEFATAMYEYVVAHPLESGTHDVMIPAFAGFFKALYGVKMPLRLTGSAYTELSTLSSADAAELLAIRLHDAVEGYRRALPISGGNPENRIF